MDRSEAGWAREANDAAQPALTPWSDDALEWTFEKASYFRRVETESRDKVGFLVGFLPGLGYESVNYRWFERRGADFAYVDRVLVVPEARSRGVGRLLYADFEEFARSAGVSRVVCEVNVRPRNEPSLEFHRKQGFAEVGESEVPGNKRVVYLEKLI